LLNHQQEIVGATFLARPVCTELLLKERKYLKQHHCIRHNFKIVHIIVGYLLSLEQR